MLIDITTVIWKEFRELFFAPGSRFGTAMTVGVSALIGIIMPLQQGMAFVSSPVSLMYALWIPATMVTGIVADSFAGERERHTLETLLAGRLSDRAILFGKLLAVVLYALGTTLICVLLGLISVNVALGHGRLLFFPPWLALGMVGLAFLASWFNAGLGLLVSLRAATAQKAQQTLAMVTLLPTVPVIGLVLILGDARFGALLASVASRLPSNIAATVGLAMLVLLAIDLALARLALARFQRARLIVD